jgi:nucleoside-diphosphate-sugar epimerase
MIKEFSRANVEIVKGNLLSRDNCMTAAEGVSIIYHLAAGIEKTFPGCFLNSVVTTRNLLDAVMKEQTLKRFVNISSLAVYSNRRIRRGGLMDESCKVDGKLVERYDAYAYGKAKQDELVLEYAQTKGLPYVLVRPGLVLGPGKAKIPGRVGIDTFGVFLHLGLNNRMPLTYVDNCAEAIVLAGLKRGIDGQVINIVDDDLPKSRHFLRMYKKRVHRFMSIPVPYPVFYLFNYFWEKYSNWSEGQLPPAFNRRMCAAYFKGNTYSNKRAKELLGWHPRIGMSEGLQSYFVYAQGVKAQK